LHSSSDDLVNDGGEVKQRLEHFLVCPSGGPIEHAQGPDCVPARGVDRNAGIEADAAIGQHVRVLGEPSVGHGVLDDKRLAGIDYVGAKRLDAGSLDGVDADAGLVPLPIDIHERHQRRGNPNRRCARRAMRSNSSSGAVSSRPSEYSAA
jgi:hypothetical protein